MVDVECPTEEYYDALAADMKSRHSKAASYVLEHLSHLEVFLDTSIVAGFSFGSDKAVIAVQKGAHLGHVISRTGATCDAERTQALEDFAPIKELQHLRQFIGCTNWIRWYMPVMYAAAVKVAGLYMKEGVEFPEKGFGSSDTDGCKAIKCSWWYG